MPADRRAGTLERVRGSVHWLRGDDHPWAVSLASIAIASTTALVLAALAGNNRVLRTLMRVELGWVPLCLGGEVLAYVGYVVALRAVTRAHDGPRMTVGFASRVVAAGFGAFFAASASGGFELDYWALRRAGAPRRDALRRVLGLGTLEYAVLAPAALVAALVLLNRHRAYPSETVPWLLVIPAFALALWLAAPRRAERLGEWEGKGVLGRYLAYAVTGFAVVRRLALAPADGALAFAGVGLYWFGEVLCLWASLRAFGAHVDVPVLILAYASGYLATRRALPAGGVGVAEVFLTLALTAFDVPFERALCGVFAYRIFNFWLALLPALLVMPTVRRIRRQAEPASVDGPHP